MTPSPARPRPPFKNLSPNFVHHVDVLLIPKRRPKTRFHRFKKEHRVIVSDSSMPRAAASSRSRSRSYSESQTRKAATSVAARAAARAGAGAARQTRRFLAALDGDEGDDELEQGGYGAGAGAGAAAGAGAGAGAGTQDGMVDSDGYVPFPPPGDSVADPPAHSWACSQTSAFATALATAPSL